MKFSQKPKKLSPFQKFPPPMLWVQAPFSSACFDRRPVGLSRQKSLGLGLGLGYVRKLATNQFNGDGVKWRRRCIPQGRGQFFGDGVSERDTESVN